MPTFALNFSRPAAQVVAQYYKLLRLGFDGYRQGAGLRRDVATWLAAEIEKLGPFELVTDGGELPVFAFKLERDDQRLHGLRRLECPPRARLARARLHLPGEPHDLAVLRVVVKRGFSHDLSDRLLADIKRQLPRLESQPAPVHTDETATAFHH